MPIAVISSKGQMTIPSEVRTALGLKATSRVLIIVEGDHAILKPIKGNILDLGGSIKIPETAKPIDFHNVREAVKKHVAERAAKGRGK